MRGTGSGARQRREDPQPIIDEVKADFADPKRRNQGLRENIEKMPRESRLQPSGEVRQKPVVGRGRLTRLPRYVWGVHEFQS
jgi:hypothetical protein